MQSWALILPTSATVLINDEIKSFFNVHSLWLFIGKEVYHK